LLLDLIKHNAEIIGKEEQRNRADAEYLAICLVLDDLATRPNGKKGHQSVMNILANEYSQHQVDVMTYLSMKSGVLKLKPEIEQQILDRHMKKQPSASSNGGSEAAPLYFKDGTAALEFACTLGCDLKRGSVLPAVVLDSKALFGTQEAVKTQPNGIQTVALKVASSDGGFLVMSQTLGPNGPKLQPGDLVAWQAGEFASAVVETLKSPDKRFGWVGFVIAALRPEFRINHGWAIAGQFND